MCHIDRTLVDVARAIQTEQKIGLVAAITNRQLLPDLVPAPGET